jgi:hypothetical protein
MGRKKSILNVLLCNIIIFSLLSAVHVMQDEAFAELKKKDLTRINEDGSVEMRVTYMNPLSKMDTAELVFEVRMNTHSVDLDVYKLDKLAILRDDTGNTYKPLGWFNPGGGGHHRFGTLKFANRHKDGSDIITKDTKELTLIIKDIDNVKERRFLWTFPLE